MNDNNNKPEEHGIDSFLTDTPEEGVAYIEPRIETKLSQKKRHQCREVVQELRKLGLLGQRQLLYLIYLLALEIEDRDTMLTITNASSSARERLEDTGKKLIVP